MNEDSEIFREEIFGPVLLVNTFKTEEDVIDRANKTEYGLLGKFLRHAVSLTGCFSGSKLILGLSIGLHFEL